MSDISPATHNRKKIFLYFALLPILLAIGLTVVPNSAVQLVAIFLVYAILFGWLVLFPIVIWIRWIAKTAELAGRSYLGFMILGIFFPLIATIIVLTFKKPSGYQK